MDTSNLFAGSFVGFFVCLFSYTSYGSEFTYHLLGAFLMVYVLCDAPIVL